MTILKYKLEKYKTRVGFERCTKSHKYVERNIGVKFVITAAPLSDNGYIRVLYSAV